MQSLFWFLAQAFTLVTHNSFTRPFTRNLLIKKTTADWPSLHFQFTLKRSSMGFYGRQEFSMFASPVVSTDDTSVLYDLFATFDDDTTAYNYTLVEGIAHLQSNVRNKHSDTPSVQCVHSESSNMPPINSIVSAINEATPVSSLSGAMGNAITCDSGRIYKVSVKGFDFALCVSSNSSFTMYGSDMDIKVDYLDTRVDIVAPKTNADSGEKCEADVSSSPVTSIGRALLTGKAALEDDSRKLSSGMSFFFDDLTSCSCKSALRPCVFIHGLGVGHETPENEDTLPYWGNISCHTPCCLSIKYAHINTVNHSWMEPAQQQKVCDRVLAVSSSSTNSVISDTIIVTHSMGTLILAGAIAHGRCKVHSSSTWVSTAAPLLGSMGSDFVQETCTGESNSLFETVAELKNQCPPTTAMKSLAYENGSYSYPQLNKAYQQVQEVYRTNVSAAMCSESYVGLFSSYQARFWVLGQVIPHKSSRNDGTVEFDSCAWGFPKSKFGNTYNHRFYRTQLNHHDMQFRGGDALWNKAKMPVKWLECLL